MMQGMKRWWNDHSEGERRIMMLLAVAAGIVFFWLGLWRPVSNGVATGWERQGAALDRYASVRAKVDAIRKLPATGKGASEAAASIDQMVGQSAAEAGFTLDRAALQGEGRMAVSIASARMPALMGWLATMEAGGILVETISISPGANEGTIAVQALLREAGR
jgi:general secretion pathway protein M